MENNEIDSLECYMDSMEAFGSNKMSLSFDVKRDPYSKYRIKIDIERIEGKE